MDATVHGFSSELEKLAARTFPIARLLTAPLSLIEMGRGAITGGTVGHALGPIGTALGGTAGAATGLMEGVGRSLARRRNFAQSTLARLLRGGEGMMEHEKNRLAEGLDVSRERLDRVIEAMREKHPERHLGAHEDVYSRFANAKTNPLAALERIVDARALAGRLAKGEPLLQHERELVDALRGRDRALRLRGALAPAAKIVGGLAAAGGAGYGSYRAVQHFKNRN